MNFDVYRYIFLISGILCGIMFAVSIILFIVFNIPKIINDLTGATARRAIKSIREQNEASGDKSHRVSKVNAERGKLTDKISPSGRIEHSDQSQMRFGMQTAKISTQQLAVPPVAEDTTVLEPEVLTTVLDSANETTVLSLMNETTDLSKLDEGTTLLSQQNSETAELGEDVSEGTFVIEYDIIMIHTDEVI